jgi:hypothetical protein
MLLRYASYYGYSEVVKLLKKYMKKGEEGGAE